ncbi:MAG: hypothetical protein IJ667_10970, partial [Synergistaceae bacterium]|nr:hypothetical protein [Synergistaceae bacterium]
MIGPVNVPGKAGQIIASSNDKIGNLNSLATSNKSTVVDAINELAVGDSAILDAINGVAAGNSAILDAVNEFTAGGGSSSKADPGLSFSETSVDFYKIDRSQTVKLSYAGTGAFTAASSDTSIATVEVNNKLKTLTINSKAPGSCSVTCALGETGNHRAVTEAIPVEILYKSLEDTDWQTIKTIGAAGTGANYWDVGDSKTITLNGTVGTLALNSFSCKVFILDFNYRGDNGVYFGGFKSTAGVDIALCDSKSNSGSEDGTKYFNMNHWGNVNYGGWKGCDLRYDILGSTDKAP